MRSSRCGFAVLVAALVVCGSVRADRDEGVTLRYKFTKGETLPYQAKQKTAMTMNVAGNDIKMDMTMTMDIEWHVRDTLPDGSGQIAQTIQHIHFTMDGGGPIGKVEYDSKTDKEPEGNLGKVMAPIFNAMVGSAFQLTLSPQGKISDFKAPEKFTDAIKNAAGGSQMFSPDQFKRMAQQNIALPTSPVTKGKTWDQKIDIKMGPLGSLTGKNVMTYVGPIDHHGQQLQQINLKPDFTLKSSDDSPVKFELKKQEGQGKVLFNSKTGQIVETTVDQTMDMVTNVGGNEMKQNIKQTTTMKLVPKK